MFRSFLKYRVLKFAWKFESFGALLPPSQRCLKGQKVPGGCRVGGCLHAQTPCYANLATSATMSPGPEAGNLVGKGLFAHLPVFAHSWSFINIGS